MERKLQERMVGAAVLILALVVIGPMVLDGGSGGDGREDSIPGQHGEELRTHTFRLNQPSTAGQAAPESASTVVPPTLRAERPAPAGGVQPQPAPPAAVLAAKPAPGIAGAEAAATPPAQARNTPEVQTHGSAVDKPTAEARAAPPAPPQSAAASGTGWLVQVGTFGQKDNAERLAASLKQRNFAAFVSPTAHDGKMLYRVRVGPSGSHETAAGVASRLAAAGQPGQVVAQ